jgi:hypothetical protein
MVLKLLFNFNDKQTNKSTVKESLMTNIKNRFNLSFK